MVEPIIRVDVLLFFAIGLFGGAHCIGMCGPLVTNYSRQMAAANGGGTNQDAATAPSSRLTTYEVRQHALFNAGRTVSYALLGAFFGAFGNVVFLTTERLTTVVDAVRGVVGIAIGVGIVVIGVKYVFGGTTAGIRIPGLTGVLSRLQSHVHRLVQGPGIVGLGAIHGFLPCPILYPAYLFAFASGSALTGGIALGAIGLGTFPTVFAYGTFLGSVGVEHRRRIHRALGVVFVLLGYVLIAHGLAAVGVHVPHPMFPHYQPLGGSHGT